MRLCGTRYDYGDVYGELAQDQKWRGYRRPAIENGEVIFPQKFSIEKLNEIRNDPTVGPYIFSCQYLLEPIDPENAMFPRRWFQYFTEWKPGPYRSYITVDQAYSMKKEADFTVIMHSKVDSQKNLFVADYVRGHLSIGDTIQVKWHDGTFVLDKAPGGGLVAHLDAKRKRQVVLETLARIIGDGESLSPNNRAGNYAAKRLLRTEQITKLGMRRPEIEKHIDKLQSEGLIKVDEYRKNGRSHDRYVIVSEDDADESKNPVYTVGADQSDEAEVSTETVINEAKE